MHKPTIYEKYIKRLLDIILSLIALIILSPVLLITALLVRIKLGSPVIFTQIRPGKDEKLFKMYKFRTMTDERDENGNLLPDEKRLTSFGKKLRSTSLDELPELFNILKGDMSFVGPRPQLVRDMLFMTERQRQRHVIRPGLTGWAQVNGRNSIDWETKLNYDLEYLKKQSLFFDIKIMFMTAKSVFVKEGISADGHVTAMDYGEELLFYQKIEKKVFHELNSLADKMVREVQNG